MAKSLAALPSPVQWFEGCLWLGSNGKERRYENNKNKFIIKVMAILLQFQG